MSDTKHLTTYKGLAGVIRKMAPEIESALPAFMRDNADRFTRVALTALHNPRLLSCTQESILASLMASAQLGLECDGVLGQGYLIPYGRQCSFQLGYRGVCQLVRRSGAVSLFKAEVVHEGDTFEWDAGEDRITHRPSKDQQRFAQPVEFVYAKATMTDGTRDCIVWSREQIEHHKRQYSKAWDKADSPWRSAWSAMAKKTVLLQLAKVLPISVEVLRTVIEDEIRATSAPVETATVSSVTEIIDHATDKARLTDLTARFSDPSSPEDAPGSTITQNAISNTLEEEEVTTLEAYNKMTARHSEQQTGDVDAAGESDNTIPRVYQTQAMADFKKCTSILECQNTHKDRTNGIAFDSSNQNWSEQKRASFMEFEQAIKDERIKTIRESRGQRAKK